MGRPADKPVHVHIAWCEESWETETFKEEMAEYEKKSFWKRLVTTKPVCPRDAYRV